MPMSCAVIMVQRRYQTVAYWLLLVSLESAHAVSQHAGVLALGLHAERVIAQGQLLLDDLVCAWLSATISSHPLLKICLMVAQILK